MESSTWKSWRYRRTFLTLLVCLPIAVHLLVGAPAEPVFNGDANRHVMTSVFFHDFYCDLPLSNPKQYAEVYYEQYPALGLLIWPPLFHAVSGAVMLVAGISDWVPRGLVFLSAALCVLLIRKIAARRDLADEGLVVGLLTALLPMMFIHSRYVMLEVPTMLLCLWSIERFDHWLTVEKTRSLYLAAFAAAMAALTRFDAALLLPTLLLMALFAGCWRQLFSWHILSAAAFAIVLVGPTYFVIWKQMGDLHMRQATESVSGTPGQFLAPGAWSFYPAAIPDQVGMAVAVCAAVGLLFGFRQRFRSLTVLFAALWIGTYVTFTPLAELLPRHSIYWIPALAWFAFCGIFSLAEAIGKLATRRAPFVATAFGTVLLLGTAAWSAGQVPVWFVRGYDDAAAFAFEQSESGDTVFVDAWWEGNFIYQLRRLDTERNRSVVRGNRLLYDFTSVPSVDMTIHTETDRDILAAIAEAAPACMVIESPQPFGNIPMAKRLRALIQSHPTAFPLLKEFPIESTFPEARPFKLLVFDVNESELSRLIKDPEPQAMTQLK